jgi:hypothetical protein
MVRVMKIKRARWVGHVAYIEGLKECINISKGLDAGDHVGFLSRKYVDCINITVAVKKETWENAD